jgi:endonuclease/exonuclease/phosphatase family metal-dependent hydrolase
MKLRVGTWNIKGGRGAKGFPFLLSKRNLDKIAEEICRANLHVVLLQEVDVKNLRCCWVHQPRYLAEDRNVAPYAIQAVPSDNENSG